MNDVIGTTVFAYQEFGKDPVSIEISITKPILDEIHKNGDWYCELRFAWSNGEKRLVPLHGVDSFGALRMAFKFFEIETKKMKETFGDKLTYLGDPNLV